MQRVSSLLPSWERRNSGIKGGGLFGWSNRNSTPNALPKLNTLAANGRLQREALWPATLDVECDKAARILKSFCDGYLPALDESALISPTTTEPNVPIKISRKIPKRVLQNAAGIAVFTCMRSGLWMTGSGGSGILIARKSDGTWSPPSGIMLHTPTLSFVIGVDVYDCVLVISNLAALESITRSHVTLGEDIGLTSGPSVPLASDEKEIKWNDLENTVLTYVKSRGQLQLVNLNGCILTERGNENGRFYASDVVQMDILAGNVARHVEETRPLFEVIKMAEGRTDFDTAVIERLSSSPAPGDALIATSQSIPPTPRSAFGFPNSTDPDPFGILALEMAGLEIREAGTQHRPISGQMDLSSGPMSPAFSKFSRQSMDTFASKSNRGSYMSARTVRSQLTDVGTQTDVGNTPETTPSPGQSEISYERSSFEQILEDKELEIDYTKIDLTPLKHLSQSELVSADDKAAVAVVADTKLPVDNSDKVSKASSCYGMDTDNEEEDTNDADDEDEDDYDNDDFDDEEEPVIFEVASVQTASTQAVASRVIHAKGNVVTIPKRIPPPLPARSPARYSRGSKSELGGDLTGLQSPLRQSFNGSDLNVGEDGMLKPPTSHVDVEPTGVAAESPEPGYAATKDSISLDTSITPDQQIETPKVEEAGSCLLSVSSSTGSIRDSKGDSASLSAGSAHSLEHSDNSDSTPSRKHTSSIYTGTTEDRWSCDGSALTTPTSYSVNGDVPSEETPKKDDTPTKKTSSDDETKPLEHEPKTATADGVSNA